MEYFGKTFKEIRENRNFSLSDVCGEHISTAQLSRFEKGKTDISISKFYKSLKKLGVSLQEFEHIQQGYQYNERRTLLEELSKATINNDTEKIKSLLENQEKKKDLGELADELDFYMAKSVLEHLTNEPYLSKKEKEKMADYLFSVSDWGYLQTSFYANTIDCYSFETVLTLSKELSKNSVYYKKITKNRRLIAQTLLNTVYICCFQFKYKEGFYFQQIVQDMLESEDLYERNVLLMMNGLLDCISSKIENGKNKMETAIQIFRVLGCDDVAKSYQKDLEKMLKLIATKSKK